MTNVQVIIAWISYLFAHGTAVIAILTAVAMFFQGPTHYHDAWLALVAAILAWSNPRKPDPSMKLG